MVSEEELLWFYGMSLGEKMHRVDGSPDWKIWEYIKAWERIECDCDDCEKIEDYMYRVYVFVDMAKREAGRNEEG